MESIKELLDIEVANRNSDCELSYDKPDPLLVAKRYNNEWVSLLCALYAYGNVRAIIGFLDGLDFCLLDKNEDEITKALEKKYYRFQNPKDVINSFVTIKRAKERFGSLESIFLAGYNTNGDVIEGIYHTIDILNRLNSYESEGYRFLFGNRPKKDSPKGASPLKRWNMFLRWMVRFDCLDMGLWSGVKKGDLIIPLDTHTFEVSKKLGLLERKTYDLYAALLLSEKLREFDKDDPIKYDFAIYRLGQESKLLE